MYLRSSNGTPLIVAPDATVNNIFDKSFGADRIDPEEWIDWMRWDGSAEQDLEKPNGLSLDRQNTSSTMSSTSNWFSEVESAEIDPILESYQVENNFSYGDAPFDVDEHFITAQSMKLQTGTLLSSIETSRRPFTGFSTLTAEEERVLKSIAMPLSQVQISSPTSLTSSSSVEPETHTPKLNKKRKSSVDEDLPAALCQSKKRGHNAIEKRYRTNLNDKINELREGVPALCHHFNEDGDEPEDSDEDGEEKAAQKYGKAAILTRALEYIQHLESTMQRLGGEVATLRTRVGAFEKLAMGGSIVLNNTVGCGISAPTDERTDTLESIQAEFKQIKPKSKAVVAPVPRKRKVSTKSTKDC